MTTLAEAPAVQESVRWDFIRYANVWEDADILCEALAPVTPGKRILSICSAGDNVLALLGLDPREVVAVDLSRAQLACLELRMAAFRRLEHADLLAFLGVTAVTGRATTYGALRSDLTPETRTFWDRRTAEIDTGVIHAGKFERYFRVFRTWVLPLVHGRAAIQELARPKSLDQQREFYRSRWDTWRWRFLFRAFFSRAVMGRIGRDPAFFSHVSGPIGERVLERTRHALTEIGLATNPYFTYIVTGNFAPGALPRYLRAEHFAGIRDRLERIRLVHGPVDGVAHGRFDGFNLSDLFEYMNADDHARCYGRLLDMANPGSRLVYWNMLVPRGVPELLHARVRPREHEATGLHARDRAWFYTGFHLDEVVA